MKKQTIAVKVFIRALIVLGFLLGSVAAHAEVVDRIVAIVNDEAITLSELNEAIEPYAKQISDARYRPEKERSMLSRLRQEILDRMIDQTLTDQECKRLGVSVPESEVDMRIDRLKAEQYLTEAELRMALEAEGYTLEEYRNQIKEQLLRMKLISIEVKSKIAVTEDNIKDYYDKHKKEYQGENKYHLRTILIRVPSAATADQKTDALKRIEAIVEKFKAGAKFDELAKEYSEDITGRDGGDLGLFSTDEISTEFRETVTCMKEGEITAVLETPQGYQVLMLEEIENSQGKSYQEARIEIQDKLHNELVDEKFKVWFKALRERSYIKIIQ